MSLVQSFRNTRRHYVKKYGRRSLQAIDRFIARQSLVGDQAFFDKSLFPYVQTLEGNWRAIRSELQVVLKARDDIPSFHEISPDQQRISRGSSWKTFILFGFGRHAERNCSFCPQTTALLDSIPHLQNAWFSILAPGYHIPPHRGVTKGLLRCHLALIVPEDRDKCRIRVHREKRPWQEGECMVFDDTFEHEVWNDTDQERVVLFLDIERPLRPAGRALNKSMLRVIQWTAYVKDARRNVPDWEARFEAAVQRADGFHMEDDSLDSGDQDTENCLPNK